MEKKRNVYIDLVKAVAIFLVVFGHCIQYGSGADFLASRAFFDNKVFRFIYSFHMPLFMLVSGYLFGFSAKKITTFHDVKATIIKKAKQLVIPLFFWSFISLGISFITENTSDISAFWLIKKFATCFINGPWFLWAVWWCSLAVIIVKWCFKDNPLVYLIGLILTFVVPDGYGLSKYKFMYPFFVLSYWFNAYGIQSKCKKVYFNKWFASGVIVLFAIMLYFFNYDTYIYNSGYTIIGKNVPVQLWNDCFRFAIGLTGSVSVLFLLYGLFALSHEKVPKWLSYIGQQTMGIYIISGMIFENIMSRISWFSEINYLITSGETVIVLLICLAIVNLLQRNKTINAMFLGGR